jgi:hypothetical protein
MLGWRHPIHSVLREVRFTFEAFRLNSLNEARIRRWPGSTNKLKTAHDRDSTDGSRKEKEAGQEIRFRSETEELGEGLGFVGGGPTLAPTRTRLPQPSRSSKEPVLSGAEG